ncbi:hypothetical protein QF044_000220 [Chryseobacterium sp. W4I1]|nr:hypothetical protein [Chryseobacterium sp. W4I1]
MVSFGIDYLYISSNTVPSVDFKIGFVLQAKKNIKIKKTIYNTTYSVALQQYFRIIKKASDKKTLISDKIYIKSH